MGVVVMWMVPSWHEAVGALRMAREKAARVVEATMGGDWPENAEWRTTADREQGTLPMFRRGYVFEGVTAHFATTLTWPGRTMGPDGLAAFLEPVDALQTVEPIGPRALVTLLGNTEIGEAFVVAMVDALRPVYPELAHAPLTEPQNEADAQRDKPGAEVRRRADLFKRIKDEHPKWGRGRVAAEATRRAKLTAGLGAKPIEYTAHHVRYAYEAMGWEWQDARTITT